MPNTIPSFDDIPVLLDKGLLVAIYKTYLESERETFDMFIKEYTELSGFKLETNKDGVRFIAPALSYGDGPSAKIVVVQFIENKNKSVGLGPIVMVLPSLEKEDEGFDPTYYKLPTKEQVIKMLEGEKKL